MGRPIHFEIHASDLARARTFYERLLGWVFHEVPGMEYWTVDTGLGKPGIDGGLLRRIGDPPAEDAPVNGFIVTVEVEDVAGAVETAVAAGGELALAAQLVPGVGELAYVRDTEGNVLGLLQVPDADADAA